MNGRVTIVAERQVIDLQNGLHECRLMQRPKSGQPQERREQRGPETAQPRAHEQKTEASIRTGLDHRSVLCV